MVDIVKGNTYAGGPVSMPLRARRRQPEIRPDQILDAAQTVLLENGLNALTMDGVAAVAGVGKGTIYHYYRSKSHLLRALRARYLGRTVAKAMRAAEAVAAAGALAQVERFLGALVEATGTDGPLIWSVFHQAPIEEDDELDAVHDPLLILVRRGVDTGEFALDDPDFTTGFIIHGLHGTVEAAFHSGDVDPARLEAGLRQAVRALLAPGAATARGA